MYYKMGHYGYGKCCKKKNCCYKKKNCCNKSSYYYKYCTPSCYQYINYQDQCCGYGYGYGYGYGGGHYY